MEHASRRRCLLLLLAHTSRLLIQAKRHESALHSFVTRPELKAPRWSVDIYDEHSVSPGYWFVAPYQHIGQTRPGDGCIGPHIYDGRGELVWSGAHLFNNMSVMDFRISKVHGEDMMTLVRPELRQGEILDTSFKVVQDIPDKGFNIHELNFQDDGKHALIIRRGVRNATREMSLATGLEGGECEANFHEIAELDAKTWEPTWTWSSYDHIGLEESTFSYGSAEDRCKAGGEWDYLHANAVDKCPDGDYLLSGRHTDTIYKISREDGHIVWRLGGLKNDYQKDFNFTRQHDVRCREQNETHTVITFLDNAKGEDPQMPSNPFSRGLRVALQHTDKQATIISNIKHPDGPKHYAHRRGDYQVLDNENVFIGWSERALQTEHTPEGELVMRASLQAKWLGTYRSYKFPFIGKPLAPPDVHAEAFDARDNSTITAVHVSQNGATEIASWKLFKTDQKGERVVELASRQKDSFETKISYAGYATFVFVQALDSEGNEVAKSKTYITIPPPDLETASVIEEELWLEGGADEEGSKQEEVKEHGPKKEAAKEDGSQEESVALESTEEEADGAKEEMYKLADDTIYAFFGGFICSFILTAIAMVVWYQRRNDASFIPQWPPWQQKSQEYQPLAEKEDRTVSMEEV